MLSFSCYNAKEKCFTYRPRIWTFLFLIIVVFFIGVFGMTYLVPLIDSESSIPLWFSILFSLIFVVWMTYTAKLVYLIRFSEQGVNAKIFLRKNISEKWADLKVDYVRMMNADLVRFTKKDNNQLLFTLPAKEMPQDLLNFIKQKLNL